MSHPFETQHPGSVPAPASSARGETRRPFVAPVVQDLGGLQALTLVSSSF